MNTHAYVGDNPLLYTDPYGLWAFGDALPQWLVNASAGFRGTLLLGQGTRLRNLFGVNGGVNSCSSNYGVGMTVGIIGTLVSGEGEAQVAERLITVEGPFEGPKPKPINWGRPIGYPDPVYLEDGCWRGQNSRPSRGGESAPVYKARRVQ